jgi:hypothetical protein
MIHDSAQDHKNDRHGLRLGACGWQHAGWEVDFYPDDLPEDWRLSYYANEFHALLLPLSELRSLDCGPQELIDEVPEGFRFYLLDDLQCSAEELAEQAALFQSCLGGVIDNRQQRLLRNGDNQPPVGDAAASRLWTPQQGGASGIAVLALGDLDLRRWRAQLEQFSRDSGGNLQALFVSDEQVDISDLHQLKTLIELMGL